MNDKEIALLPNLWIKTELINRRGEVISRSEREGHSWVCNAYVCLLGNLIPINGDGTGYGAGELNVKTVAGVVYGYIGLIQSFQAEGGAMGNAIYADTGVDSHGIHVGTSAAAFSFVDYVLPGKISTGNSMGQLHYGKMANAVPEAAWNGVALTWMQTYERYFNNNSGGTINVAEVGITVYGLYPYYGNYLIARDVLDTPIPVADTDQLRVEYTITQTLPE